MNKKKLLFKINKEIENLPSLGRNIQKIRGLAENPYSDLREIAELIKRDVAITAQILKVGNSARYMQRSKVDTVEHAIKIIGFREVKGIVMSFEARRVMEEKYPEMTEVWDHSHKVGFYAQQLKRILIQKQAWEDIYISGLLHDMGKIILFQVDPDIIQKINFLSQEKKVSITIVEKMAIGMTHSDIGSMISEKWNYPENVNQCIKYHHEPSMASDNYRNSVHAVYLANEIANMESGSNLNFDNLDIKALEYFGINSEDDFSKIKTTLNHLYQGIKPVETAEDN